MSTIETAERDSELNSNFCASEILFIYIFLFLGGGRGYVRKSLVPIPCIKFLFSSTCILLILRGDCLLAVWNSESRLGCVLL